MPLRECNLWELLNLKWEEKSHANPGLLEFEKNVTEADCLELLVHKEFNPASNHCLKFMLAEVVQPSSQH